MVLYRGALSKLADCSANFALDPNLLDLSQSCVQSSSDLCDIDPLQLDQQVACSSAFASTTLDVVDGLTPPQQLHSASLEALTGSHSAVDTMSPQGPARQHTNVPLNDRTGLPRRRSRYLVRADAGPIVIPNATAPDPLERWRESPPEDEPAPMSAILNALQDTSTYHSRSGRSSNAAFRHHRRAPSATSGESSASSNTSIGSTLSTEDPLGRTATGRTGKPTRRRREATRRFCCTFCCDKFKSKYDWVRHEKSLHLSLEAWVCTPAGSTIFSTVTGRSHCAFCNAVDPSPAHLNEHNHDACHDDARMRRSFRRKDHLVQHLRLVHSLDTLPWIDDWKMGQSSIPSRCGFCDHAMDTWEERVDHLAGHFRKNATMNDWKGDHGFPPSIAAQVTNALPPYLIGSESHSIIPFSATNTHVRDHFAQISARAHYLNAELDSPSTEPAPSKATATDPTLLEQLSSFSQVLTLHLSRFAREHMKQGVIPTDEMFQQESRRVLYGSEDSWNQTIADHPGWLSDFRNSYCTERDGAETPHEENVSQAGTRS
ncbi:hypothetical protein BDV25DRAFT_170099 [Aspergillus avenaceus]|uniref:C2H2-type domain-containing protein n=1 Tax=Aspergillus avenaceus TaxID=36643 RepID=A0A5N6THW4_ASPAV|nr:hypothetical protein BDV25DRAFT_170099 [Aspergillus avenaceus]